MRASYSANAPTPLPTARSAELLPLVAELSAVLDPDELFASLADVLRRLVDYRRLELYLSQPDGTLLVAFSRRDDGSTPPQDGHPLIRAAAERRQPLFVPEAEGPGGGAELALPLLQADRLIGVLLLAADVGALHEEGRAALQALAGHLAVAISNARLHREARWYAGLLATLYDIGKETASILDLDELLARVAQVVKRVIDYEIFGILLLDEQGGELVLRKSVSYGCIPEKTRIPLGEGLCGTAALTKEPILVGDVSADPRYLNLIPQARSELVVPLVHQDRLVGVFDLESTLLNRFTEEHLKVLTPLASQVASAIANARLVDELVEQKERLQRELRIAQRVQHGLFPEECPSGPGWEAAAQFHPARELGGDLYDFYDLEEGGLGLAVGDISGKGVPAALYGAFTSGTVRARAFQRHRPADLLFRANRTLRRRGVEGLFCTLAYAVFDFPGGRLRLANSGLPYPLHYRSQTGLCEAVDLPGVPLGAFDDSTYEERELELRPGDVFLFHTDGVSEASRDGEEYGLRRLREVLQRHAASSAAGIAQAVVDDLHRFVGEGEPGDDRTLVVVKVRP